MVLLQFIENCIIMSYLSFPRKRESRTKALDSPVKPGNDGNTETYDINLHESIVAKQDSIPNGFGTGFKGSSVS